MAMKLTKLMTAALLMVAGVMLTADGVDAANRGCRTRAPRRDRSCVQAPTCCGVSVAPSCVAPSACPSACNSCCPTTGVNYPAVEGSAPAAAPMKEEYSPKPEEAPAPEAPAPMPKVDAPKADVPPAAEAPKADAPAAEAPAADAPKTDAPPAADAPAADAAK